MSLSTCLLCFAVNVKTFNIKGTHLQYVYEEITDYKVHTHLHTLCYVCHAKLQQCYQLLKQTRNIQVDYLPLVQLTAVKISNTLQCHSVTIKQEPDVKEESSDCVKVEIDAEDDQEQFEVNEAEERNNLYMCIYDNKTTPGEENCDICKNEFRGRNNLNKHMLTHNGELSKMNRGTCLMCFAVNVKTFNIKDTHLLFYKEIIDFKVEAQTHPHSLCYICHTKSQQFYNLVTQTRNIQMSDEDENVQIEYRPLVQLSTVMVLNTSVPYHSVTIKQEPDVKEESSDCLKVDMDLEDNKEKCEVKEAEEGRTEHKTTSDEKKLHSCDICNKKFSQKGNLNTHKLTHTGVKPYSCDICNKKFSRKGTLNIHKLTHTCVKPYNCDICNNKFSQKGYLKKHQLTHVGAKSYCCNICNKAYFKISSLKRHQLTHSGVKSYICYICNKKFSHKNTLNTHKLIHTDVKPYSCDICKKKFNQKGNLNGHKRTHFSAKPYSCDICDKKFSKPASLNVHKLRHACIKPYSCDLCNKKFCDRSGLNQHKLLHTGDKPYSCDICIKKFRARSLLNRHKLIHSGVKPYSCDICNKKFGQKSNLKAHKVTHNGAKPYSCDICNTKFTQKSSLNRHKLTHRQTCDIYNKEFSQRQVI